jgi:AcrR family transcriptional regulator
MDTRQRILDTAERLFGENGYAGTSLRQIIGAAEVNLAAIHYHFGSKEDLLDQLVMRKAEGVNRHRLELLDRCEGEAGTDPPAVDCVVSAFLRPTFAVAGQHPQFARLMGRLYGEGLMPRVAGKHFQPVVTRFLTALRRSLPDLPHQELLWRLHFMLGAMAHTLCHRHGPPVGTLGGPEPAESGEALEELIAFVSAGLRAPALRKTRKEQG